MTKFTPTPEPWSVHRLTSLAKAFELSIALNGEICETEEFVAVTNSDLTQLVGLIFPKDAQLSNAHLIALAPRMLRAIISMVGHGERGDFIGRTSPNVQSFNTEGEKGIRLAIEILNELDPGGVL